MNAKKGIQMSLDGVLHKRLNRLRIDGRSRIRHRIHNQLIRPASGWGDGNGRGFMNAVSLIQHPLDLCGADLDPPQVHGVISPAQSLEIVPPEAADLVPMPPKNLFITPAGMLGASGTSGGSLEIYLVMIAIEQLVGEADRGRDQEHFAGGGFIALIVENDQIESEGGGGEGGGGRGLDCGGGDVPASDFRPATVFNDGFVAGAAHQPEHVLGV